MMFERKKVLYGSIVFFVLSMLVSAFIEYYPVGVVKNSIFMGHRDFFGNIALGCSTGALFSIFMSIISVHEYTNNKKCDLIDHLTRITVYLFSLPCNSESRVWLKEEWYFNYIKNHTLELCDNISEECDSILLDLELSMLRKNRNMVKYDSMINRLRGVKKWAGATKKSLNYPVIPTLVEHNLATIIYDIENHIDSMKELFTEVGDILFLTKYGKNKFNSLMKDFFNTLDNKLEER